MVEGKGTFLQKQNMKRVGSSRAKFSAKLSVIRIPERTGLCHDSTWNAVSSVTHLIKGPWYR